jgi:hypothetical protein
MLKEIISEKHTGNPTEYQNMEEKILEQKVLISQQNKKNRELEAELKQKTKENEMQKDKMKANGQELSKKSKLKDKVKRQKKVIEEYKEKIQKLTKENEELESKMEEVTQNDDKKIERKEEDLNQISVVMELRKDIEKLRKEKEDMKKNTTDIERKLKDKDREIQKEQIKFKDKEEEITLKFYEDNEKFNQRIVLRKLIFLLIIIIVERELELKNKELESCGKKTKENVVQKANAPINELTKKLVEEQELLYATNLYRMKLIMSQMKLDQFKQVYFLKTISRKYFQITGLRKGYQ